MRRTPNRIILAVFGLLCFFCSSAHAEGLRCLLNAQGDSIRWNKSWQKDKLDNNVTYQVKQTRRGKRKDRPSVVLELRAGAEARKKVRYIEVASQQIAAKMCARMGRSAPIGSLHRAFPGAHTISSHTEPMALRKDSLGKKINKKTSPFIKYSRSGWIRATHPPGGELTFCKVHGRTFACSKSDKEQFGDQLKQLELEQRALR